MSNDDRDRRGSVRVPGTPRHAARSDKSPWNWLLLLPLVVTLYPPFYNHRSPTVAGIPFFYAYQLGVIAVGVVSTYVVYRRTRR